MNHVQVDPEINTNLEGKSVEAAFKQLWDKARAAVELISQLKEQNRDAYSRIDELEQEANRLKSELIQKEQDLKRLQSEHTRLAHSLAGNNIWTEAEKEAVKSRIRDLIAKINSHL